MKYLQEFREKEQVELLVRAINQTVTRPWNIMEICGGQTYSIARYRIEDMLPDKISLLHGPGCPVCVTPVETIDNALAIAEQPNVIFASFGDMMRVPGSCEDLLSVKAKGADVRLLYSPLDAISMAEKHPDKEIVFFAIGFETTIPVYLIVVKEAGRRKLKNFSLLTSLFCVPPAIEAILSEENNFVNGFLTAGHVCAITGNDVYQQLAKKYNRPMAVTGFEPVDILLGIYQCILQLEAGKAKVVNAYKRVVSAEGNVYAKKEMQEMLVPVDQEWRGIGVIPGSGLQLNAKYEDFDAAKKFDWIVNQPKQANEQSNSCIAGEIMKGNKQAADCPHFGVTCRPENPIGAPMVSAEGICAAYYQFRGKGKVES